MTFDIGIPQKRGACREQVHGKRSQVHARRGCRSFISGQGQFRLAYNVKRNNTLLTLQREKAIL